MPCSVSEAVTLNQTGLRACNFQSGLEEVRDMGHFLSHTPAWLRSSPVVLSI